MEEKVIRRFIARSVTTTVKIIITKRIRAHYNQASKDDGATTAKLLLMIQAIVVGIRNIQQKVLMKENMMVIIMMFP